MIMRMTHEMFTSTRIDEVRKQKKMSQSNYGHLIGVSQSTASRKLSGEIPFAADEVRVSASHFGVSADYLCGLTDDPSPVKVA